MPTLFHNILAKCFCLFSVFCITEQTVLAQQKSRADWNRWVEVYGDTARIVNGEHPYYLLSWEIELPKEFKVVRWLGDKTAIVETINPFAAIHFPGSVRMMSVNDNWKLSPATGMLNQHKNRKEQFIVSGKNITTLTNQLQQWKNEVVVLQKDELSRSVVILATPAFVFKNIVSLPEVIFTDKRAEPVAEISIIGYDRGFHGINAVDYSIPGANGKGIVAGVKEQKMEAQDLDLFQRIDPSLLAANTVTNHATVVSSIIGGAGNSFYDGRGIANQCRFYSSNFSNLFADDAAVLNTANVSVQNHSYGTVVQSFYGAEAVSYDAQTWQHHHLLHIFSAGNQGTQAANSGAYANIPGYANLTGNFKMAKNIITVGALDTKGNIAAESSSGPLYDGRIAPQLTALGPNGTSDAAAMVSGAVAVIQQVYKDSNAQQLPPASLVKALLYNTADDIHRPGIDYKTGYGLLNSFDAVQSLQRKEYDGTTLLPNQQWTKTISIPADAARLKVTLSWTDSEATTNNNKALLNDLDLMVVHTATNTVYRPWVLSTFAHADSLAQLPTRKRDSLHTAEQVTIELPPAGNYEIQVLGTSVNQPIPFHIAFHIDTLNRFSFISPQHTSDVNRQENPELDIRWKTFVADTNTTGALAVSYDAGVNWQLITTAHKIYRNQYKWPVKDTQSRAMFRMQTAFGDFFSGEFVISPVVRPVVDFLCTDSFRLSWNKHVYANAYRLYALVDSPYLKPLLTVTDSFAVIHTQQYPWNVWAVEPVLGNGIPASRSVAQDIHLQGAHCFYRTFYHTLLNDNHLDLFFETGAPGYIDSLFFEQVTNSGQLVNTAGALKASVNIFNYTQLVTAVPPGTSYWRVRIKLKSGGIIYTEILSVTTSGKRFILFYPNPVSRNETLTYVLKQGVPNDSRLQLFDITGRLLRTYTEMPGTISTAPLPPGILVYKLVNSSGEVLETGKLVLLQ